SGELHAVVPAAHVSRQEPRSRSGEAPIRGGQRIATERSQPCPTASARVRKDNEEARVVEEVRLGIGCGNSRRLHRIVLIARIDAVKRIGSENVARRGRLAVGGFRPVVVHAAAGSTEKDVPYSCRSDRSRKGYRWELDQ